MTRIEDKPGPELDAILLEKLFNWRWIEGPKYDYDGPCESHKVLIPPTISDDEAYRLFPPKGVIAPTHFVIGRRLSTSWEGMRLVVEEMQRRGWEWQIWYGHRDGLVTCEFSDPEGGRGIISSDSDTAPYAAVLAAIQALQGEDTQYGKVLEL